MKTLDVFESARCCPTGVGGVNVAPVPALFAAGLRRVAGPGVEVECDKLGQEARAFAANPSVILKMDAGMSFRLLR